jgi:hypothetical protein
MSIKRSRDGFTLIELSLSMLFIAVLSISIVLIIVNTISAYQRGLMLNKVNSTGTNIADEMRIAVQSSSARSLLASCSANKYVNNLGDSDSQQLQIDACYADNAHNYAYIVKYATGFTLGGVSYNNVPIYGAFCTGTYTFLWNSGYYDSDEAMFNEKRSNEWAKISYIGPSGGVENWAGGKRFRLIMVQDNNRNICASKMRDNTYALSNNISNTFDITAIGSGTLGEVVDLLPTDSSNDLALYDLDVAIPSINAAGDNVFYAVSFILGTISGGVNILSNGNSCVAPNESSTGLTYNNYCAINKFSFSVQVNGG